MARIRRLTVWAVALLWLMAGACDDPQSPGGVEAFHLTANRTALVAGEDVVVRAVSKAGEDITGRVAWTSSDPSTVVVDGGLATGVAPGVTYVVARFNDAVDSLRLNVRFSALAEGEMAVRIQGDQGGDPVRFGGFTYFIDQLVMEGLDHTSIQASAAGTDPLVPDSIVPPVDTVMHIALPMAPAEGSYRFDSWELMELDGNIGFRGRAGVSFEILDRDNPDRTELYVSVDSFDVELETVELPATAGVETGRLVGRVAFEAAGVYVDRTAAPPEVVGQIGDETVHIYVEFDTRLRVWPIGGATFQIEGGPQQTDAIQVGGTQAAAFDEGLLLEHGMLLPPTPDWEVLGLTQAWIGSPATGSYTLGESAPAYLTGPEAYGADSLWVWTGLGPDVDQVFKGQAPLNGFSASGTVSVDRYEAPTPETFGIIEGSIEAEQPLYDADGPTGESQTLHLDFVTPIYPTNMGRWYVRPPYMLGDPGAPPPGGGQAALFGRAVVDDGLRAAPGVAVQIVKGDIVVRDTTDENGMFAFPAIQAGSHSLSFVPPDGLIPAANQATVVDPINVLDGDTVSLTLYLADDDSTGTLRATVIADSANAMSGVEVRVYDAGGDTPVATLTTSGEAGSRGQADFDLAPGIYDVEVVPTEGYTPPAGQPARQPGWQVRTGHLTMVLFPLVPG